MTDGPAPPPRPGKVRAFTKVSGFVPQILMQRCSLHRVDASGASWELTQSDSILGSAPDAEIHIDHPTVSRHHCLISSDGASYTVRDLDSTNGTLIDGIRVKEAYLRPNSVLRMGDVELKCSVRPEPTFLEPAASFPGLSGRCDRMRRIFAALHKVAATEATVLLQGETGTGKSATARAIHNASPRHKKPFVVFDCGAVSPNLIESMLFGHERGAFTGAHIKRAGSLAAARGGTLLIDELASLPLSLQSRFLRALEEREFTPVGSDVSQRLDCRVIASTQRDLWSEVAAGRFRQDLLFRVSVVTIPLPPLRDRLEDLPGLVDHFLAELSGNQPARFSGHADLPEDLKNKLTGYEWPGNIRELRNAISNLEVMEDVDPAWPRLAPQNPLASPATAPVVPELHLNDAPQTEDVAFPVDYNLPFKEAKAAIMETFERRYLEKLLERCEGNMAKASREGGINRRHLYTLVTKYGLDRS